MPGPLEVIIIPDETIDPPGPKMIVCIENALGFYYRINSRPNWQFPLKLIRDPLHLFLDHDSYLECGEPLEVDDYLVDAAMNKKGVIGIIHPSLKPQIIAIVTNAKLIAKKDKNAILAFIR